MYTECIKSGGGGDDDVVKRLNSYTRDGAYARTERARSEKIQKPREGEGGEESKRKKCEANRMIHNNDTIGTG